MTRYINLFVFKMSMNKDISSMLKQFVREKKLPIKISGESMQPLIRSGEKVIIVSANALKPGDIICAKGSCGIMVHRIIRRLKNQRFLVKGDNNFIGDPILSNKDVIGKVIAIRSGKIRINTMPWRFANRMIALFSYLQLAVYAGFMAKSSSGDKFSKQFKNAVVMISNPFLFIVHILHKQ